MENVSAAAAGSREERSPLRPRLKRTAATSGFEWCPQPTNKMKAVNHTDKKHACFCPMVRSLGGGHSPSEPNWRRYLRIVCRCSAVIEGFPSGEPPLTAFNENIYRTKPIYLLEMWIGATFCRYYVDSAAIC